MQHVKKKKGLKWFTFLCLLSFRGMRPAEALAVNILDFSEEFTRLTWREAKTNKLRVREYIIADVAKLIKTYVTLNAHSLVDGYLFPFYKVKVKGKPFMTSKVIATWFCHDVRDELKAKYPAFNEWFPVNGPTKRNYRIALYSFRRFFETYIYLNNTFAPRSVALIKEIMEYNSRFDPIKHYIRVCHQEEEKASIIEQTFSPLASVMMEGQTQLAEYS